MRATPAELQAYDSWINEGMPLVGCTGGSGGAGMMATSTDGGARGGGTPGNGGGAPGNGGGAPGNGGGAPGNGAGAPGNGGAAGATGSGGGAPADAGTASGGGGGATCTSRALPPQISSLLKTYCQLCHGSTPLPGVPASLVTYDD